MKGKKIEARITKCYLVEVVVGDVYEYYESEYYFGKLDGAKKLMQEMKEKAKKKMEERSWEKDLAN